MKCEAGHNSARRYGDHCVVCNRPIKTDQSKKIGAGPNCVKKVGGIQVVEFLQAEAEGQINMFEEGQKGRGEA